MKKLYITLLTTFTCGMAHALPLQNPADPSLLSQGFIWQRNSCAPCSGVWDNLSLRIGLYGDYVFQRHLEIDNSDNHAAIDKSEIYTNAGYLALNFYNRVDIFTTLGATSLSLDTNIKTFDPTFDTTFSLQFKTLQHFSWSIGARATLFHCNCTALGIEGQYFSTTPNVNRVVQTYDDSLYPTGLTMHYNEWQIGIGITQRIALLAPYLGIKWSKAHLTFNQSFIESFALPLLDLTNRNYCAFVLGLSFIDCRRVSLTVEGRYGDEKAVHANGQIRF